MDTPKNLNYTILLVNLSNKKIEVKTISYNHAIFKKYLGGLGLIAEYIMDNTSPNIDPLGSENVLCFVTGIFSGTNIPFSGRFTVVGKSPLTGTWGEANCGGKFGPELKKTGYDAIIVIGKSDELSIIKINDQEVTINRATELKGKDCFETEEILKQAFDMKSQVASIGMAGENQVLISGIVTDKGRIAARCGLGAVMGSKNLKAIIVRGTKSIFEAKPEEIKEIGLLMRKKIKKGPHAILKPSLKATTAFSPWLRRFGVKNLGSLSPNSIILESLKRWGTAAGTAVSVEIGDAPVRNWKGNYKDFPLKKSSKITSDGITQYQTKNYGCKTCPLACGGILTYKDELYNFKETKKPEYETLAMLGTNLLNEDLGSILAMNDYCNRQGLDTIASGSILGFLIEALQEGYINKDQIDGLTLDWGIPDNYLTILEKIVKREGVGDILANGVGETASKLGLIDKNIAIHVKNQAIPAHDPRFSNSLVLPYLLDPAPARHTAFMELIMDISKFSSFYKSKKSSRFFDFYCYLQIVTTLGMCQFGLQTGEFPVLELVNLMTDLNFSMEDIIKAGHRTLVIKHLFNLREGVNIFENQLPDRIKPSSKEFTDEEDLKLVPMINDYLTYLGYDLEEKIFRKEILTALDL